MKQKYDAADDLCIAAAGKLNALLAAGSPRAAEAQVELKMLRWIGIASKPIGAGRDRHHREVGSTDSADIQGFVDKCLIDLRGLGSQRTVRVVDEWFSTSASRWSGLKPTSMRSTKKEIVARGVMRDPGYEASIHTRRQAAITDFDARLATSTPIR